MIWGFKGCMSLRTRYYSRHDLSWLHDSDSFGFCPPGHSLLLHDDQWLFLATHRLPQVPCLSANYATNLLGFPDFPLRSLWMPSWPHNSCTLSIYQIKVRWMPEQSFYQHKANLCPLELWSASLAECRKMKMFLQQMFNGAVEGFWPCHLGLM